MKLKVLMNIEQPAFIDEGPCLRETDVLSILPVYHHPKKLRSHSM